MNKKITITILIIILIVSLCLIFPGDAYIEALRLGGGMF
jgi:hypothetical protein